MGNIRSVLKKHYDLEITDILPQQGGWASLAFKALNENRNLFLKVYEKNRASTPKLTAFIDYYIPILVWLINNSNLKGKIPVPISTKSGQYKCEDEYGVYLLYDYIKGQTIGEQDLTDDQVRQLSNIISELHLIWIQ